MNDTEVLSLLPKSSPKDALEWLHRKGNLNQSYLVYKYGRKTKTGAVANVCCTACKQNFELEWVPPPLGKSYYRSPTGGVKYNDDKARHTGDSGWCIKCRKDGVFVHTSRLSYAQNAVWFLTVEKRGPAVVLCGHEAVRSLTKDCEFNEYARPWEAYVFAPGAKGRVARYKTVHYNKLFTSIWYTKEWEMRRRVVDTWQRAELIYPWRARDLHGTVLENAKLKDYCTELRGKCVPEPVQYLMEYQKHPAVENLVTNGQSLFVREYLRGDWEHSGLMDWKAKQPAKMLRLNREELRMLGGKSLLPGTLIVYQRCREALGRPLKPQEWDDTQELRIRRADKATFETLGKDIVKAARYLKKQRKNCHLHELTDYWRFLKQLGEDPHDPQLRWPKNLVQAHDQAAERVAELKKRGKAKAYTEMFERLQGLSWEKDGLCIRPAESANELRREGKELHHCVGGYGSDHLEGKSIFFIRRTEAPDAPFFTLQMDITEGCVVQNRGCRNCSRTPEVRRFEKDWLEQVVAPWLVEGTKAAKKKKQPKKEARKQKQAAPAA